MRGGSPMTTETKSQHIELFIAHLLRWGVSISFAIVAIGIVLVVATGQTGYASIRLDDLNSIVQYRPGHPDYPNSLADVRNHLARFARLDCDSCDARRGIRTGILCRTGLDLRDHHGVRPGDASFEFWARRRGGMNAPRCSSPAWLATDESVCQKQGNGVYWDLQNLISRKGQ
jgi:hypothetical protein